MASVSSNSVPVDELKDLLTCSFCLETLNEPRSLPCFHNFCNVCLGKYVTSLRGSGKNIETFPCPTCRSEFTLKANQEVAGMSSNYFIKNMLEIVSIQRQAKGSTKCSRCEADSAVNHCATCGVFMCEKCSAAHDSWSAMRNHNILSLEELNNPEAQLKTRSPLHCTKHEGKILEYYCETCKELSCIHCMVLNHLKQDHSCMAVSEVAQKHREALQSSCTTLDEKISEGKEALNTICEVMKSLEKNAQTTKGRIREQKENVLKFVVEKLEKREEEMNKNVGEACCELHAELSRQHDEIKEYLGKVQGSVTLPRNLLKRGSIEEILSSQRVIDENIEKLRKDQPENLAPVNDGAIKYVPEVIDDSIADVTVHTLGCIGMLLQIENVVRCKTSSYPLYYMSVDVQYFFKMFSSEFLTRSVCM